MRNGLFQIFLANIVSLLIGSILSFLVPKYLSVESYSLYKTYALYITCAGFFHFGYADGMYLKYGGKKINEINKHDLANNFHNFFIIIFIVAVLFCFFGILKKNYIIFAFGMGQLATNLLSYLKSLYQATGEFSSYSNALYCEKIGIFLLTILFLFAFKSDNYLVYVGIQVFVGLFVSLYLFFRLNNRFHFLKKGKVSFHECYDNIKSGFVLMLGNFSSIIFTGLDCWFVKFLMDSMSFAFYSFSSSLLNLLNVFITPITVYLYNYFCRGIDNEKVLKLKRLILAWGLILIAAAFPVKLLILSYLQKYSGALKVIFILFASQIFVAVIQGVYVNLYKAKHMQNEYLKQMLLMLLIGLITNYIFYYFFKSIESFSYATMVTYIIWFLSCEIKNPEIQYTASDYIATIFLLIIYFILSDKVKPVFSLFIYFISYVIIIKIFINDVWTFGSESIKSIFCNIKENIPYISKRN